MTQSPQTPPATRIEKDALGEVRVPADHLWGAQTQRSIDNFPIGVDRFRWGRAGDPRIRRAQEVRGDRQRRARRVAAPTRSTLIERAAQEVIDGKLDAEFPLVVFQTGSGTQSNMNANEVIANRAIQLAGGVVGSKKPIHPNDDVNRGQSSNDTFPAVMHIATVDELDRALFPALERLRTTLDAKAQAFADVVMIGRTHLQDATPVTLGQVISGWVAQLDDARADARSSRATRCCRWRSAARRSAPASTRIRASATWRRRRSRAKPACRSSSAPNKFAALSAHDAIVNVSAALRTLAGALMKIANDVRWHASGPRAGLGEITIPDNEPGSSIMPGKINPTQCEALTMVAVRVFGNDAAVAFAGSQGNFQLNVYKPVMLHGVLESIALLADAMSSFDERCAQGIEPNLARIRENVERSLMLVTALNPHIGYENAAKIALTAHRESLSLREAALRLKLVSAEDFDRWVDPAAMTRPGSGS